MSASVTVKTLVTTLQSGDMAFAASSMSDAFFITGFAQIPLNKTEFLAAQSSLCAAMPDSMTQEKQLFRSPLTFYFL